MVRISVALADKEMARDVVAAIPRNLIAHLAKADETRAGKGVARINHTIAEAADFAEEKHKDVANRLVIHGADSADAGEGNSHARRSGGLFLKAIPDFGD